MDKNKKELEKKKTKINKFLKKIILFNITKLILLKKFFTSALDGANKNGSIPIKYK